jgi:DNA-binding transcriptional ArsR family regulator
MPKSSLHAAHHGEARPDESVVRSITETMHALATASRVRLLYALIDEERTVGDLADETQMTPAAASQQLRVLRHLRLVAARRDGQSVCYRLYDEHLGDLLREIHHHAEHALREWASPPSPALRA